MLELLNSFDKNQHHFLVFGGSIDIVDSKHKHQITYIDAPLKQNFLRKSFIIFKRLRSSSKIIYHGLPLYFYAIIFPSVIKKVAWVIYGGTDLYYQKTGSFVRDWLNILARKFFLKRVRMHLTHIEGDSSYANANYHSKARFFYHPVYLSNVFDHHKQLNNRMDNATLSLLVGNSTDPSNHHVEIFEWLKELLGNAPCNIYCPLSYGHYKEYKEEVKKLGYEFFGNRFIPIENFMTPTEYNKFLDGIDIAIFNHKRQEAMGVTLTLLSLGKEVYMNAKTSSFLSLIERGFQVYDNALLISNPEGFGKRDVSKNAALIKQYYSKQVWRQQWEKLYQLNSFE